MYPSPKARKSQYFTPDQLATMEELGQRSYSQEAGERIQALHPGEWTEEDQRRVDERYAIMHAEVKRLVAEGRDADSPEAQALAAESIQLLNEFTCGDSQIESGLRQWWENYEALPDAQKPFPSPLTKQEADFLERSKTIYRQGQHGAS